MTHLSLARGICAAIIVLCCINIAFAQVINIESKRMQTDSIRFAGRGDLALWYNDNNGNYIFNLQASSTNQFKSKSLRDIFLIMANYRGVFSETIDFQNDWNAHIRYNRKITHLWRMEAFAQTSGNRILDVNQRHLGGLGVRMKVIDTDNHNLYIGNSYLFEHETSTDVDVTNINHRHNLYASLSSTFGKNKKLNIINTVYWQPKYGYLEDFNVLEQLKVDYSLTELLNLFFSLDYYLDTDTPKDNRQYSLLTKLGLGLKY